MGKRNITVRWHMDWAQMDEDARWAAARHILTQRVRVHIVHRANFSDGTTVEDYWDEGIVDGLGAGLARDDLCFYIRNLRPAPHDDWPASWWHWDLITEVEGLP